jgi:hypothetical protein
MAERYNPNTRKRRETTFGGLDALNQPAQQDTPFFGLEGREQLQGVNRPTTAIPKKKRGFDMPGAQIKPTIPVGEPAKLDPVTGGGHPGAMNVVGSAYDAKFGPLFSSDPGKGRPAPTPPLAKRPWQETRPSPKPTNGIVGGATTHKPKSRAQDKLRSSILKDHANEAGQEALDEFGYGRMEGSRAKLKGGGEYVRPGSEEDTLNRFGYGMPKNADYGYYQDSGGGFDFPFGDREKYEQSWIAAGRPPKYQNTVPDASTIHPWDANAYGEREKRWEEAGRPASGTNPLQQRQPRNPSFR